MRQEILHTVQQSPGIHFREVQRQIDCTSTTLNYHLDVLDLKERDIHGYRRFYPRDVPEELERPLAALNHDVRGLILYQMQGGITQKGLVENMDISKSTVSSHLKVMREDGLVNEEKKGRSKKLFPSKKSWKALNQYAGTVLNEASEGFIEMWE